MRGEVSHTKLAKRHPLDWYVEQGWEWDQIVDAIGLEPELADEVMIWDPCCGFGHSSARLQAYVHTGDLLMSDVVDNVAWPDFEFGGPASPAPRWFSADFLEVTERPASPLSIWFNPPYSYRPGIAEAMVRHALKLATHRVVALMSNKWLAPGKDVKRWSNRSRLFRIDHPPQAVLHFSERPSMPPGDRIHLMGKRAYCGGMVDYCAIVWDVRTPTAPGETRTIWLPPLGEAA